MSRGISGKRSTRPSESLGQAAPARDTPSPSYENNFIKEIQENAAQQRQAHSDFPRETFESAPACTNDRRNTREKAPNAFREELWDIARKERRNESGRTEKNGFAESTGREESAAALEAENGRNNTQNPALSLEYPHAGELPRILFVTNALHTGGAETHILSLTRGLLRRGYFVAVVSAGGEMEAELEALGVPHIYAPLDSRLPHHLLASRRILRKAVRQYDIDILHSHSRLASLACRMLGSSAKRRFVSTAHLDFPVGPLTRRLGFWGEKTLAVSEDIRGYLIREYKLSYENIVLTVNGIDTDRFAPRPTETDPTQPGSAFGSAGSDGGKTFRDRGASGNSENLVPAGISLTAAESSAKQALRPAGDKILLHVSRIDKDRAYTAFLLCDIIGLLNERYGVRLIILGGGELYDKLSKKVSAVNRLYGDIVKAPGPVTDITPYMQNASLFVGVSRAALEAMSCGIPTILSGNSGYMGIYRKSLLSEAAKTNFCCRGKPPATRSALLSDLEKLLQADAALLNEISAECRTTVTEHYSLDKMVSDYVAFYDSLRPLKRKKRNKIAILGYHGYDNLGDEAILAEMVKALRQKEPACGITVLSGNPKKTSATHCVCAVGRKSPAALTAMLSAHIVYVGGGTILQADSSRLSFLYYAFLIGLARLGGATVAYWANGMSQYQGMMQPIVAWLLRGRTVITLRDVQSQDMVTSLFAKKGKTPFFSAVTADSGLLTPPCDPSRFHALREEFALGRYVLIATNGCIRRRDYARTLAHAAMLAAEKGDRPLLLLMQPHADRKSAERVATEVKKRCGLTIPILSPSPREAAALISSAVFVLSSRLHALIFAAAAAVPAVAYGTGDKCRLFAEELFGEAFALSADHDGENELKYALTALYEQREALRHTIAEKVGPLKRAAEETPQILFRESARLAEALVGKHPKKRAEKAARRASAASGRTRNTLSCPKEGRAKETRPAKRRRKEQKIHARSKKLSSLPPVKPAGEERL